jgi:uncharacterized protein YecE (DUF72 family)
MEKQTGSVLVGTAGWEHEEFDRVLYPGEGMESTAKLARYSGTFDVVEVRSTFWDDALGEPDARTWMDAVRDNRRFQFLVKLHRSFTHERTVRPKITRAVRGLLQELVHHDRLGALLIQFPLSFTATSGHRFHLIKLAEIFEGFPIHVEFRHDSWHQPWLPPFLAEHRLHPVNADFPRVNHLMPFLTGVSGTTAYIRLHGRNENGWLRGMWDARYDYLYNGREVRELARRISLLTQKCSRVLVVCNNTTHGKSVATALQLAAASREERLIAVPEKTLEAFPQLQDIALPEPAGLLFDPERYRRAI